MQHKQPKSMRPAIQAPGLETEADRVGAQAMSGQDLSGARAQPAPNTPVLDALARSRGQDIHLGPGREQHLPHEAWHVAQQR